MQETTKKEKDMEKDMVNRDPTTGRFIKARRTQKKACACAKAKTTKVDAKCAKTKTTKAATKKAAPKAKKAVKKTTKNAK